jgi:mono/diheme cytochrome c family protein
MTLLCLLALASGIAAWKRFGAVPMRGVDKGTFAKAPTFNRDIAPLIFAHCAPCHRPGQAAPFDLLTYADVRKRARQIAEVTQQHLMPPWLPDPAANEFVGQRALQPEQIALIKRWVEQGTVEGDPSEVPSPPQWRDGWQLGPADLVVQMDTPYRLLAEGRDVYRNFVIPLPNATRRFVRAIEFQPGNARVVHHAFLRIDSTRESRRWDARDPEPGFDGLHTPSTARPPEGHFLSWQPGKRPLPEAEGMAWILETNCDLVVQMHLRPSGKPESIRASIGFYFTDRPPTRRPLSIGMRNFALDIPAGESNHVVRDSFQIPVDVEVIGVLPHAHYLGRDLRSVGTLPDGSTRTLFHIPRWDFNWQGEYRYVRPLLLPAGTVVSMVYVYDNSTNNPVNPHQPPSRVTYGLQSDDEMAELSLQVVPRREEDRDRLIRSYQPRMLSETIAYNRYLLGLNPNDGHALCELGKSLVVQGDYAIAEHNLRAAATLQPDLDEPHYWLGLSFRLQKRLPEAQAEFDTAVRLNPENAKAHGNLGIVLLEQGDLPAAELHLRRALALNPDDTLARQALEEIVKGAGRK